MLLPAGLGRMLSAEDLRAVALHELAHVKRRDPLVLMLASLVRALLWFHPLVWLGCRHLSRLAETACDDAVLESGGEPVRYAKMLTRFAERLPRRQPVTELATGLALSRGAFFRRIESILSDRRAQVRRLTRLALGATVLAALASLVLGAALPLGEKAKKAGPHETETGTMAVGAKRYFLSPTIERVVNDDGVGEEIFIDFDVGKTITPPADLRPTAGEMTEWAAKNGVDAMCKTSVSVKGLVGFDMVVHPIANEFWDAINPRWLREREMLADGKPGNPVFRGSAVFSFPPPPPGLAQPRSGRSPAVPSETVFRCARGETCPAGWAERRARSGGMGRQNPALRDQNPSRKPPEPLAVLPALTDPSRPRRAGSDQGTPPDPRASCPGA